MKVLIIGGGGREHALAWKAAQSPTVTQVFVAPGNAGTALEPGLTNVSIDPTDIEANLEFAKKEGVGLTIVGPEAPLVLGIVDKFKAAGLKCFGPSAWAAQLEGSKAFTKDFLAKHQIPSAQYQTFTEIDKAIAYIKAKGAPIVVKADGLAAGKGVIVAQSESEAIAAVEDMLADNRFGEAGHRVVIEEYLVGEEASFICMVDGENILPLATSQDHKARDNGDTGPNTGGMGAYSPAPAITPALHQRIMSEIIEPTVKGLKAAGHPYTGFLYAGIMISPDSDLNVLEYNCRFGDPETQPIMLRLKSDLVALCLAAIDGRLDQETADWDQRAAIGIVLAAGGYPDDYRKGDTISGLPPISALGHDDTSEYKVFHAGTQITGDTITGDHVVTAGGRVLCVTALGSSVTEAQKTAYAISKNITWNDVYYRTDIGYRAIAREKEHALKKNP